MREFSNKAASVWVRGLSVVLRAGLGGLAVAGPTPGPTVTIADIAAGIEKHIAAKSQADGGSFKLAYGGKELRLELVRVHLEYLAHLGQGVSFACVDMVGSDGPVYDVDFFLKGAPGEMTVTETSLHKINGQPRYAWDQKRDGTWRKVPASKASARLLGVVRGADDFEFTYRVRLPRLEGPGQLWLPLAGSDAFQQVELKRSQAPQPWRELAETRHGNRVLLLALSPKDSGQRVELGYRVRRREKAPYAAPAPDAARYLEPERLVPATDEFRRVAAEVTRSQPTPVRRARALYDHVIEKMRYARYGKGWGRGDALYACEAKSGNCSDFHAYFIALARAAGIPARFAIGAAIPAERNDGGIDGYHCWAEFYAEGRWFPVDVSEANKNTCLASYYFGHHPANRFELGKGRDLLIEPGPASGAINFLAYPVLEVAGRPVAAPTEFTFRRVTARSERARR